MRSKIVLSLFLVMISCVNARSQSVYFFQYRSSDAKDTILYNAFFVKYNTGAGFMRIRYDEPGTGSPIMAEMKIHSQEIEISKGVTDTSRTYYDTIGHPKIMFGSSKILIPVPVFWFTLNQAANAFEPTGVFFKNAQGVNQPGTLVAKKLMKQEELDKDFLSQFFSRGEGFFDGYTQSSSREIFANLKIRMHVVIVANTNDPAVGKSAWLDMDRMERTFDTIARFMGIQRPTPVKIYGKNYTKENVQKAIRDLKPEPNDIVVFYYTGHGFRKNTDSRQFPYIDLRPKDDGTYMVNSLNIKDIYDSIRLKPTAAHLNLVISDCCNTIPGTKKSNGKSIVTERGMTDWSPANCAKLFLSTKTSLLFTAADKDQTASCDSTSGSFFTIYFKAAMENNLVKSNKNPGWTQVMQEASEETINKVHHICCGDPCSWSAGFCVQNPVKQIETGKLTGLLGRLFQ